MGIRQWFNNPEEKRAFNEVERIWPDLAKWAETAIISRSNKAALDRMRTDAVLRRMYRAAAAKFFRFDKFILRVVPGMKYLAAEPTAEVVDLGSDDGWVALEDQGVYLASRIVGDATTQPATLWNAFNRTGVRTLIVDIELTVADEYWNKKFPGSNQRLPDRMATAEIIFTRSGRLDCSVAIDLRCPIEAGPWQIFSLSGKGHVKFLRGGGMCPVAPVVYPQWWGANPEADASINSDAFNAAVSCFHEEGVICIPTGRYQVDRTIDLTLQTNTTIELRGEDPEGSCIEYTGPRDEPCILNATARLRDFTLRGPYDFDLAHAPPLPSNRRMSCGIRHVAEHGGLVASNLRIEGFAIGIHSRASGMDVRPYLVEPETGKHQWVYTDRTVLTMTSLTRLQLVYVGWGIVFDSGANGNSLREIAVRNARVGVLFPPQYRLPAILPIDAGPGQLIPHPDDTSSHKDLFTKKIPPVNLFINQPPSTTPFRDCTFEDVTEAGVHFATGVAAPCFDNCRFVRCATGILFDPGCVRVQPAFIGRCAFDECPRNVVAPSANGLVSDPWLVFAGSEGTSDVAPGGNDWTPGDRVDNSMRQPKEGDPAGWVFIGDEPVSVEDSLIEGFRHFDVPVDTSPAATGPRVVAASTVVTTPRKR